MANEKKELETESVLVLPFGLAFRFQIGFALLFNWLGLWFVLALYCRLYRVNRMDIGLLVELLGLGLGGMDGGKGRGNNNIIIYLNHGYYD